jgi:hypothetical protein
MVGSVAHPTLPKAKSSRLEPFSSVSDRPPGRGVDDRGGGEVRIKT